MQSSWLVGRKKSAMASPEGSYRALLVSERFVYSSIRWTIVRRTPGSANRVQLTDSLPIFWCFAIGDLFDQIDNAAAELGIVDPSERTGQSEAFGGREKVGHVGW
ncbi:hypothetical protein BRAS3843_1890009 [Bradyrhizobium sp. STM 3843]|nr:hypothetical protein BRAS3843_1890009 [Bradyrhizobium sp. STM 3843]